MNTNVVILVQTAFSDNPNKYHWYQVNDIIILLQWSVNWRSILFRYTCWLKKCVGEESSETPLPSDGLTEASDVELADQSINQACYKHTQLRMIMSRPRFAAEEEEIFWGDANCLMILLIFNQSSSVFLGLGKKEVVWIFARHTLAKNVYAGSADNNDKQLIVASKGNTCFLLGN